MNSLQESIVRRNKWNKFDKLRQVSLALNIILVFIKFWDVYLFFADKVSLK